MGNTPTPAAALSEGVLLHHPEGAQTGGLRIVNTQMVLDPTAVPGYTRRTSAEKTRRTRNAQRFVGTDPYALCFSS
jgi:hypothetical protein